MVSACFYGNTFISPSLFTELEIRQKKGILLKSIAFLVVEDPKPGIGSGSATLNALLCVAEYLAAKDGMTVRRVRGWKRPGLICLRAHIHVQVVSEEALCNAHILILHMVKGQHISACYNYNRCSD